MPLPGEQGSRLSLSAPTPHFRRPTETPFGKIQPVFDGFALAETSWASDSSFATSTPRPAFKLPHKTPETKRRRREEIYTPAPAHDDSWASTHEAHEDDLFARRLADSGRHTPLAPMPQETYQTFEPPLPVPAVASRPALVAAALLNKPRGPSRAERARAAGIPLLSTRSSARPPPRALPPLRHPIPPQTRPNIPPASASPPDASPPPSLSARASLSDKDRHRSASSRPRPSTPLIDATLDASASTILGRPENWDLALSTPTSAPSSRRHANGGTMPPVASRTPPDSEGHHSAVVHVEHENVASPGVPTLHFEPRPEPQPDSRLGRPAEPRLEGSPAPSCPPAPARAATATEDSSDSKESGGILGFLTSILFNPTHPPPPARKASSRPPARPATKASKPGRNETRPVRAANKATVAQQRRRPLGEIDAVNVDRAQPPQKRKNPSSPAKAAPPAAHVADRATGVMPRRRPPGERDAVNVDHAPPRLKRKDPPSPAKAAPALDMQPLRRGPARSSAPPSYARSTAATAGRTVSNPGPKLRGSSRPMSLSTAPHPVSRITPFVAQALARLGKPGESATSAAKPVTVADHERAREIAIRKAVFERVGKGEELPPPVPLLHSAIHSAPPVQTLSARGPGAATRERADAQARNKMRRDFKAAEEARRAEVEARVRAEVEAELDRQARQATVFRANPLPEMYRRH